MIVPVKVVDPCSLIVVADRSPNSGTTLATFTVVVSVVVPVSSLILIPLINSISRRFEVACDRHALNLTGNHAAFRSAFTKLARLNKADLDPHPVEVLLFHDHPPIAARLALADESGHE